MISELHEDAGSNPRWDWGPCMHIKLFYEQLIPVFHLISTNGKSYSLRSRCEICLAATAVVFSQGLIWADLQSTTVLASSQIESQNECM